MWDGVNFEEVKACWAEELGEFRLETILGALKNLRPHPPTLPEFIALCVEERRTKPLIKPSAMIEHEPYVENQAKDGKTAQERCLETAQRLGMMRIFKGLT